jgi:hypothetical protein
MAENPDTRPAVGAAIQVSDTPDAPFIFCAGAVLTIAKVPGQE